MSITRAAVRTQAKQVAQDPGSGGVQLLLADPDSYNEAIDQATRLFSQDRPNVRVVEQVLAAGGFRQVLSGTGAWAGLTGLDGWVDGGSYVLTVYHPWDATSQGLGPLDANTWRVVRDPGAKVILEFASQVPALGDTVRLEFVRPHVVHESDAAQSSILVADQDAFVVLTAALILQIAAIRAAQNTGNTGLPNDVVDRRSQSDIFRSRSKELMTLYASLVGKPATTDGQAAVKPASGFKDLDLPVLSPVGAMWHSTARR